MHGAFPAVRARKRTTAPVAVLPAREYNAKHQQHLQRKEEAVHAPEAGRHSALPQCYTCGVGARAHLLRAMKGQLLACRSVGGLALITKWNLSASRGGTWAGRPGSAPTVRVKLDFVHFLAPYNNCTRWHKA